MHIRLIFLLFVFFYLISLMPHSLHMFQQNSYKNRRYFRWLLGPSNRILKGNDSFVFLSCLFFAIYEKTAGLWAFVFAFLSFLFLYGAYAGHRLLISIRSIKKPLVFTPRVNRLFFTTLLSISLSLLLISKQPSFFMTAFVFCIAFLLPFFIMAANVINKPVEFFINQWYIKDAKRILAENPHRTVIGITGSYGKTSTKNILSQTLSRDYTVLATPGSYNTLMGVVRTIRESLLPIHDVFIVEMGAKEPGDIKAICDLVSPHMGVITSIGPQHLETFKTIETVKKTKNELFMGIRPGGKAFVNLSDSLIQSLEKRDDISYVGFGQAPLFSEFKGPIYKGQNMEISGNGTAFDLVFPEQVTLRVCTALLGAHNVDNVLCSLSIANEMKSNMLKLLSQIGRISPMVHRLSTKRGAYGELIIDDAFNSNPIGAKNALEVLKAVSGNKKYIITPGMIELGKESESRNREFGRQISAVCDYVVLVGKKQTEPIYEGLCDAGYETNRIYIAQSFIQGYDFLKDFLTPEDVLLIENDLPDAFQG